MLLPRSAYVGSAQGSLHSLWAYLLVLTMSSTHTCTPCWGSFPGPQTEHSAYIRTSYWNIFLVAEVDPNILFLLIYLRCSLTIEFRVL